MLLEKKNAGNLSPWCLLILKEKKKREECITKYFKTLDVWSGCELGEKEEKKRKRDDNGWKKRREM